MKFVERRVRNFAILGLVTVVIFFTLNVIDYSLNAHQFYSGWLMLLLIVGVLSFYIKKRLTILPLGKGATWAQWHYYVGLFVFILFAKHINFSLVMWLIKLTLIH